MNQSARISVRSLAIGFLAGLIALGLVIMVRERQAMGVLRKGEPYYCGSKTVNVSLNQQLAPNGAIPDVFVVCAHTNDTVTWQIADNEPIDSFSVDFDNGAKPFKPDNGHFDSANPKSGPAKPPCFLCADQSYTYTLTITPHGKPPVTFDPGGIIMK